MARIWNKHKQSSFDYAQDKNTRLKRKVFVAMSGGVDSSVAAALLKKEGVVVPGHPELCRRVDVVGVFMKCWDETGPFSASCTAPDDERSARLAAEHLGIPFYSWNFVKEYKEKVVSYMLDGYKRGLTPNPDMMCNKEIKFGLFFEKAMRLGADYIATGHYARLRQGALVEGVDKNKDQSYFLGRIRPEVLGRVMFPVGDYTKSQVRALAKKFALPNAERKESQGVCFIGKLDFSDFLKAHIHEKAGNIRNADGTIIGKHRGLALYTIGQRKRIGLSGGPYYVAGKDGKTNTLFVSKNEKDLLSDEVVVQDTAWFLQEHPTGAMEVRVKIRYRQKAAEATLTPAAPETHPFETHRVCLRFQEPQRAVTPGQFAVLYRGEQVICAGVIS